MNDFLVWRDPQHLDTYLVSRDEIEDMKIGYYGAVQILRKEHDLEAAKAGAHWITCGTANGDYPRFMSLDQVNDHIAELNHPTEYPAPTPAIMDKFGDATRAAIAKVSGDSQDRMAQDRILLARMARFVNIDIRTSTAPTAIRELRAWLQSHPESAKALEVYR